MLVCDICNEMVFDPMDRSVSTATLRRATENGFIPAMIRDMEKEAGTPGSRSRADALWASTIKMGAASDWSLCHECYADVMAYAEGAPRVSQHTLQNDVFISYATEDAEFANQLAGGLMVRGVKVWFAPISLKLGDQILTGIEEGLRTSHSGLIVVSTAFLEKQWTNYELDILLRQAIENKKPLLQVWHNVTKEQIDRRYMGLSGLLSVDSSSGLRNIIESVAVACTRFAPLRGTTPLWESPRYRFLAGKGEIQLQQRGGATISIFELLVNFGKDDFPLALDGELFSRRDLAQHAMRAMKNDPGSAGRWTDTGRLLEVLRDEGLDTENW
jgi:hypothetical protein